MNHIKITGYGSALPETRLNFGNDTRYRLQKDENFMDLISTAVNKAFVKANTDMSGIDCIICATATPLQAIPCNASLVHEHLAKGYDIPAMDINSSCTSFISALDTMSYLLCAGKYRRILIISGDIASCALNPYEQESYELFSDAAVAFIVEGTSEERGVLYCRQKTWSEGAHDTEIKRGGGLSTVFEMNEENHNEYYFSMNGIRVLKLCSRVLKPFIDECFMQSNISMTDLDLIVPHQASRALYLIMEKLGFHKDTYIDLVAEYGNMVSASVPFALCNSIENGKIKRGNTILLLGTAAGFSSSFMVLKY